MTVTEATEIEELRKEAEHLLSQNRELRDEIAELEASVSDLEKEVDEAEQKVDDDLESLKSLMRDIHEAVVAAGEGNAAAGRWASDMIGREIPDLRSTEGTARYLNEIRPADFWS